MKKNALEKILRSESRADEKLVRLTLERMKTAPTRSLRWVYATAAFLCMAIATASFFFLGGNSDAGDYKTITLSYCSASRGSTSEVAVTGDFTEWRDVKLTPSKEGNCWSAELKVKKDSRYRYVFIVDGQSVCDPVSPLKVKDGFGRYNSVIRI